MIFASEMVEAILDGRKTQTRRLPKLAPSGNPVLVCRYRQGRSYAVQPGRAKRGIARIRVERVHGQLLGNISQEEARAEGFADRAAFFKHWERLHGDSDPGIGRGRFVWVIRFALVQTP